MNITDNKKPSSVWKYEMKTGFLGILFRQEFFKSFYAEIDVY